MKRSFLRRVARLLIGMLLLAQITISAYACPGLATDAATKVAMSVAAAVNDGAGQASAFPVQQMPNCEDMMGSMDPSFANLCAEHCHQGQQSDHAATLNVPSVVLTALYFAPLAPELIVALRPSADRASARAAAAPPLAVLHCCFRI